MKSLRIVGQEQHHHDHDHSGADACRVGPAISTLDPSAVTPVPARRYSGKAAVVTLGCAKNHVDSEVMLGVLQQRGFDIVADVKEADVAIVNTCGFLQSAVKESIDCILDIAELKKSGRLRKLVVAGCAVERYQDPSGKGGSMREALPEVDSFITVNQVLQVADAASLDSDLQNPGLGSILTDAARPYFLYDDSMPRALATKPHTAYVKISEGCNRPCTFCIIPKIRGPMRSRPIDSIVREVGSLGQMGVREVNLVAQDLTSYGLDLRGESSGRQLTRLLQELDKQAAVDWIRVLYSYPIGIDAELLRAIADLPRICKYLDLPLQHSSESVLTTMKRPIGRYAPRRMAEFIRTTAPELALRTTFIVGFPGETEEDVDDLEAFIREGYFSSVGIFTYSLEEGTPAYDLKGRVPERVKKARYDRLMLAQQEVAAERGESFVGKRFPVLVEGLHEETDLLLTGRAAFQAPEVDGTVIINEIEGWDGEGSITDVVPLGDIVTVEIREAAGYDLVGTIVEQA